MGLHLDIDKISADNKLKPGIRKYQGVLINEGDKLTKDEKIRLKAENEEKYGVPFEVYSKIQLPEPTEIKVFKLEDILNHKRELSSVERINMLLELQGYLQEKLRRA